MQQDLIGKMYHDDKRVDSGVDYDFYIMIGGTDKFINDFINSSFMKYEGFRGNWCVVTKKDTDPNVINKEITSRVCLVPFSKFIYALPLIYMYII